MTFDVLVRVWLKDGVLDPAGEAVRDALAGLGLDAERVRLGKLVRMTIAAPGEAEARARASDACHRLLANPVLERFEIEVRPAAGADDAPAAATGAA